MPAHPHDRPFRRIFSNPAHSVAELRALLPPELLDTVDLSRLEVVAGASFVEEPLEALFQS